MKAHSKKAIMPAIAHCLKEISDTKIQMIKGDYPQYDKNCKKYIKEMKSLIKFYRKRIKEIEA